MSYDDNFDEEFTIDETTLNSDTELLKLAYRNEIIAPEILDYKADLINKMKFRIENYENAIEREDVTSVDDSFRIMLYEMDIERIRYLTVGYLRIRLEKIEKYHRYIQQRDLLARLSADEITFLNDITGLTKEYFDSSLNDHFSKPPYVSDNDMITQTSQVIVQFNQYSENEMNSPFPNRKKLVGVRLYKNQEPLEIPIEGDLDGEGTSIQINNDHVTIVEFDIIESYLIDGNDFELSYSLCSSNKSIQFHFLFLFFFFRFLFSLLFFFYDSNLFFQYILL